MFKWYGICGFLWVLAGCTTLDSQYYRLHPQVLQKAVQACPEKHPAGMDCATLRSLEVEANQLGIAFQSNPQEFGHEIALMQEQLAHGKNVQSAERQALKNRIAQRLAIVRWLASPEK